MNAQGRKRQTACTNVHKAPVWSQLSKPYTGALKRNDQIWTRFIGRPPKAWRPPPDRTNAQGRKWQTARKNVHKAPVWSQLSKPYTGALPRCDAFRPTKRMHKGENRKQPAWTCTRHWCGHNLANLIRAPSNEMTRPKLVSSGTLPRRDTLRPTKWTHKGENGKRPTQTCIRHPCGHNLANLIWAPSQGTMPSARPNERIREKKENGPHECAQGTRAVTT